jgi:hypothetical protein
MKYRLKAIATLSFTIVMVISIVILVRREQINSASPIHVSGHLGLVINEERKVLFVDLVNDNVLAVSSVIEEIGFPTDIDFDPATNDLYIASGRGKNQNDYYSLVRANIDLESYQVLSVEPINFVDTGGLNTTELDNGVYAVTSVVLSPVNDELYIGYSDPNMKVTLVLHRTTGEILRQLDSAVLKRHRFSPAGNEAAEVFPAGMKWENGEIVSSWEGGLAILDLTTGHWGAVQALSESIGLNPPWGSQTTKFYYFRNIDELEVYDSNSGTLISSIDLTAITGLQNLSQNVVRIDDHILALTMRTMDGVGYIVKINADESEVVSKVSLGAPTAGPLIGIRQ